MFKDVNFRLIEANVYTILPIWIKEILLLLRIISWSSESIAPYIK